MTSWRGLVALRRVDQILAAVREQMLLARRVVDARHLPGVDVEAVLALLREADVEGHDVVLHVVGHELREPLLLHPVLVKRRHEVRELARHPELDFELPSGEYQSVLERKW